MSCNRPRSLIGPLSRRGPSHQAPRISRPAALIVLLLRASPWPPDIIIVDGYGIDNRVRKKNTSWHHDYWRWRLDLVERHTVVCVTIVVGFINYFLEFER